MCSMTPGHYLDGPSASGKGTVAARVAASLGFHYLIRALYRLMALYAMRNQIALDHEARLAMAAVRLPATFAEGVVKPEGEDVSDAIRAEEVGHRRVQSGGLCCAPPCCSAARLSPGAGLVTDGRDMGSVVFPRRHGEGVPHRQRRRTRAPPP